MEDNPQLQLGDVTTVNVTKMKGGKQRNVLPACIEVTVDIRLSVTVDPKEFEKMLQRWAKEAGDGVEVEYLIKQEYCAPTSTDESNPYWKSFKNAIDDCGLKIKPLVFPAGTDIYYVRALGIPAIGFSPMPNTPVLLHDHNEFLHADVYLEGIRTYTKILENIGNSQK